MIEFVYYKMENTDSDQEVVREPFEDERSLVSVEQSPENTDRYICNLTLGDHNEINDKDNKYFGKPIDDQTKHPEEVYHESESFSDDDNSSSDTGDVDFAKKFGIQLKRKSTKREMAIDKLMKSTHIQEASDKPKPIIKTSITSDCIYHKGTFYQKGDIVALCDQDDGQIYFAQLTGFLQDQYCEKSGSVNWLVPTRPTSRELFDPSAYRIGLEDVQLRKLDCMTFVRHCPHDYYIRKFFQSEDATNELGPSAVRSRSNKNQNYIWTTMKPCRLPITQTE